MKGRISSRVISRRMDGQEIDHQIYLKFLNMIFFCYEILLSKARKKIYILYLFNTSSFLCMDFNKKNSSSKED